MTVHLTFKNTAHSSLVHTLIYIIEHIIILQMLFKDKYSLHDKTKLITCLGSRKNLFNIQKWNLWLIKTPKKKKKKGRPRSTIIPLRYRRPLYDILGIKIFFIHNSSSTIHCSLSFPFLFLIYSVAVLYIYGNSYIYM